MAWVTREWPGATSTECPRRVGKRVVREYVGTGEKAELAAAQDELRRARRRAGRAEEARERQRWDAACRPRVVLIRHTDRLVVTALGASGFHRHHHEWGRSNVSTKQEAAPPGEATTDELMKHLEADLQPEGMPAGRRKAAPGQRPGADPLGELLRRAEKGDQAVLPQLREALDADPRLWEGPGDLARVAEHCWLVLTYPTNLWLREAARKKLEAMRRELAGPSAGPLERLLAERVAACWLQASYCDATYAEKVREPLADSTRRDLLSSDMAGRGQRALFDGDEAAGGRAQAAQAVPVAAADAAAGR